MRARTSTTPKAMPSFLAVASFVSAFVLKILAMPARSDHGSAIRVARQAGGREARAAWWRRTLGRLERAHGLPRRDVRRRLRLELGSRHVLHALDRASVLHTAYVLLHELGRVLLLGPFGHQRAKHRL